MLVDQEFVRAINAIEPERTHGSLIIFGPPSTQINVFYAVKWKLKMFFLLIPHDIGIYVTHAQSLINGTFKLGIFENGDLCEFCGTTSNRVWFV